MPLEPQTEMLLTQMAVLPPLHTSTPTQVREMMKTMAVAGEVEPATDARMQTASIEENGEDYFLGKMDMIWFMNHYLNNEEEKTNPLVSPLLTANLRGLPPALVITAEFDPLRDEGELYANRLKEAGVPVTLSRYNGTIHGFVSMANFLDLGKQGLAEAATALRAAFAASSLSTHDADSYDR